MNNNQPIQPSFSLVLLLIMISGMVMAQPPAATQAADPLAPPIQPNVEVVPSQVGATQPLTSLNSPDRGGLGHTWIVDTLADGDDGECMSDCTLREAVSLASAGDTIMFAPAIAGSKITLEHDPFGPTVEIIIDKNLTIDNSNHLEKMVISGNNYSGIFKVNYQKHLTLKNLILEHSLSSYGAISTSSQSTVMIENCWFRENGQNHAGGGALRNNQGLVIIQQSLFTNNTGNNGGAIHNYGTLEIYDSTFENNLARSSGGAIYNRLNSGEVTIERSTFTTNSTLDHHGGAIYHAGGINNWLTSRNNTFHNNLATSGGAIYAITNTTMMIVNSTFSGNGASNGAAGVHTFGNLLLYNSILANSVAGVDCYWNAPGSPAVVNNLIQNNSLSPHACGTPVLTSNPLLDPLQDNGGFTKTMALHQTSPAIDAGDSGSHPFHGHPFCASTDQRGVIRPQGSECDLGAYEYVTPPIVLSILRADPNPTSAASVNYIVTFSKPVTGVTISDFTLAATGSIFDPAVTGVSGPGDTYTVTVDTGFGIGTLRLNVIDNDSITDGVHPLGGEGAGNGNFTNGESYTINHPPSFTSTPVTTTLYLAPYTYSIVTFDPDTAAGDQRVLNAIELPDWLTLTEYGNGNGKLEGTPGTGIFGDFSIRLAVTDSMGASATQAFNLRVNRPPALTSTPNTRATVESAYTYFITATDPDEDTLTITTTKRPGWLGFTNHGDGTATLSGTPASGDIGDDNLTVNLSDGHATASQAFTISVKSNHPPYFTSTPVTGAVANSLYTYPITTADPEGNPITISAPTKPAWLTLTNTDPGTAILSGTPTNAHVGDHGVVLQAADADDKENQSFTITVAKNNDDPSFNSTPVTAVNVASLYTYDITVTDPNITDQLTITAPTLPGWLTLTDHGNRTATLTGRPRNSDVGDGAVTLRVDDPYGGSAQQPFTITINRPPAFTSTPSTTAYTNYLHQYDITATDLDGDSLTFSVLTKPDTWDEYYFHDYGNGTALFRAIPRMTHEGQAFPVVVQVTDGIGTTQQSFSISVTKNHPPQIISTPIRLAVIGQPYTYQVIAEDIDGQPLTFTAPTKPDWVTLTDNGDGTATLSATPAAGNVGSHSINLLVRDNLLVAGLEQSFSLNVIAANSAPTDITLSNRFVLEHQPVNTMVGWFTTTDPDPGDTHTYTLVSGTDDTGNGAFHIVGNQLRTAEVFDAASQSTYSIRVRTTDLYGLSFERVFTIEVTQINLPPTDIILSDNVIEENSPYYTFVGTLSTTDPNISETFTYTMASGYGDSSNGNFSIFNQNELRTFASSSAFDYETQSSHSVRIRSTDSGGLYFEKVFTIIIEDVNEAPTDILLSNNRVEEGQPVGTLVGILSTVDQDVGDTHIYELVGGEIYWPDNDYFRIENDELLTDGVFDYETKNSYNIQVSTTDSGSKYFLKTFTILVVREGSGTIFLPLILR